jgi:hypothetical protein
MLFALTKFSLLVTDFRSDASIGASSAFDRPIPPAAVYDNATSSQCDIAPIEKMIRETKTIQSTICAHLVLEYRAILGFMNTFPKIPTPDKIMLVKAVLTIDPVILRSSTIKSMLKAVTEIVTATRPAQ